MFLLGIYIGIKILQHGKHILRKTASGIPDTDMKAGALIFFSGGDVDMYVQNFPHNDLIFDRVFHKVQKHQRHNRCIVQRFLAGREQAQRAGIADGGKLHVVFYKLQLF